MPTNAPDRPIDARDRIPAGRLCYSVAEAADALRVSSRQVYMLAARYGLPTVKIGGRRLVRRTDLEAWLVALPVDCLGHGAAERAKA